MANYTLPINSLYAETGDDIYAKPLDGNFSGANWGDDAVGAIEVADTNVYEIVLDETKGYVIYLNGHTQSFTADAGTDTITATAHGLINGETLRFKGGDLPAGLSQVTVYFVRDVTTNTFKVAATGGGTAINITDAGSGTMTFTAPGERSKASDTKIGTVPIVKAATLTGEAEDDLIAAMVTAINADTTQTTARTNAATAATQATTAATQTAAAALRTAVGLESANLASLVQAVIGKKTVTDNGDGTYDIAIRNTTDTTTLVTIRHNPVTGATIVV